MRGYVRPLAGYRARVSRTVSALALLAIVAAGCGGTARPRGSAQGVPPALARAWEGRASAIAAAASSGDNCRAMRLADSLRDDVLAQERKVPPRLRSPLVTGVDPLAERLTCTRTVTMETTPGPPPDKPPHKPAHGPPGHQHGRGHGHGHGHKGDR
jgi:hypothetical protein